MIFKKTKPKTDRPIIVYLIRDKNWIPVSITKAYDIHDFFKIYHWGLENIPNSLWIIAMEKNMTHLSELRHRKVYREWVFYFPTDEEAMAFKLRWI